MKLYTRLNGLIYQDIAVIRLIRLEFLLRKILGKKIKQNVLKRQDLVLTDIVDLLSKRGQWKCLQHIMGSLCSLGE